MRTDVTNRRLGNKLRMLREVHNYTQEHIADVLEVSINTYSQMEKGQARFTIDRIQKLADLYKMDIGELLNTNEQNIIHSITNSNGISGIANVSETVNINNGLAEEERKLYQESVQRLEAQVEQLMNLVEKLSTGK